MKPKKEFVDDYYETAYHHDRTGRIVQSRRRSRMLHGAAAAGKKEHDSLSTSNASPLSRSSRPKSVSVVGWQCPSQVSQALAVHVTSTCRKSTKNKAVVIVENEKPEVAIKNLGKPAQQVNAGPTPPQTPRSGRLPTPELSDLEDAPFCDCGVDAHVIKYCQGCNREVESHHY